MISFGISLTSGQDALRKINIEEFYHLVRNPSESVVTLINQLRRISGVDPKKYKELKKLLPYVVCAQFSPPVRRVENFNFLQYFIIDIDNVGEKGLIVNEVKTKICSDDRVLMCFVSPGEDGLKVVFKLNEKCFDPGLYSTFYKIFVNSFAVCHNIEQVIDSKTSDVSRACFISYDPNIYINLNAKEIEIASFVDESNFFETNQKLKDIDYSTNSTKTEIVKNDNIPQDVYNKIRQQLNPLLKAKIESSKNIYIPSELIEKVDKINNKLLSFDFEILNILNINYGKKYLLKFNDKNAEVNIFFGKRGFTVVESPKTGTDAELNKLSHDIIMNAIYE